MMIVDARVMHSVETPEDVAAHVLRNRPTVPLVWPGPRDLRGGDSHAVAYVNLGRWVADCPAAPCRHPMTGERGVGAEYVSPGLPFMCQWCWNADIGDRFREVDFPPDRGTLEAELLRRVEPDNRNWLPGETVADLQIENIAHGVGS